ncbi:hypothetical protein GOODEAATRI_004101 [Goodea atripinnis]|uniref:Uncharacterized protein n=1 Tax=Goodea atripinnis TaxID=208336 RepID=A0ABV0PV76_9TELE
MEVINVSWVCLCKLVTADLSLRLIDCSAHSGCLYLQLTCLDILTLSETPSKKVGRTMKDVFYKEINAANGLELKLDKQYSDCFFSDESFFSLPCSVSSEVY